MLFKLYKMKVKFNVKLNLIFTYYNNNKVKLLIQLKII